MISNLDFTDNKASSKVLRAPGGGSSDIFGSEMPQTPRGHVKNRMASNIFAAEKDNGVKNNVRQGAHRFYFIGDAPRRGQKTVDSHNRLFGEPTRPITPAKNHMKSSIPFGGQNTEAAAAQKLLTTNGHYNGKSGSVSSASSSVSSSTENLKMNSGSRGVFRNMSTAPGSKSNPIPSVRDPACPLTPEPSIPEIPPPDVLPIDIPCKEIEVGDIPADNYTYNQSDKRDEAIQSRCDSGTNPEKPYSLNHMEGPADLQEPMHPCPDTLKEAAQQCKMDSRNPITGLGLNGDGVGGLKPKKQKNREGNPVTGEGYKPGANDFHQRADSSQGGTPIINKNRVPPGGYSSGLW
ncbi:microtubule-associated protein Jupiter isoform X2 [Drosophila ananassae]|uniref:microtubule-associated protein Jupiter isoform X2 n=1 Tax=Drosophila ananassae TaxID=7217 RepID=UPI0013A5EC9C|nr:microtubule-associated protein Jupiter isoform X2 [Drosophila ananassae]